MVSYLKDMEDISVVNIAGQVSRLKFAISIDTITTTPSSIMPLLYLLLLIHFFSTFSVTISPSTIIEWSDRFSLKFANDVNTTMRVPALQKMYDRAPKIVIQVDGSVEVSAAAASVGSILGKK